jgi:serine O-acetyltransferase
VDSASAGNLEEQARAIALRFLEAIPEMRAHLLEDASAAMEGDPAAQSLVEVVMTYPSIRAIAAYRAAHFLHEEGVPLIPRMMTEVLHGRTGIDIHPGAQISPGLFIDHGTGVVIGETTVIGNRVKIYQGVTLGALSVKRDESGAWADGQRHPTIEDGVTIYAGATILGGGTIIGENAIIGGNVWITRSVPAHTKVLIDPPYLVYENTLDGTIRRETRDKDS